MYCLFIDSGVEPGLVALIKDDVVVGTVSMASKEPMFPFSCFDELLQDKVLGLSDIRFLAVGVGPGSFTGVRTSVTVAQTISYALQKPLISIPTPLRYLPEQDGRYVVALDARQGGAFCLFAEVRHGNVTSDFRLEKHSLESLVHISKEQSVQIIADVRLYERLPGTCTLAAECFKHIAFWCHRAWQKKEYILGETPSLLYLGKTQAECSLVSEKCL